MSSSTACGDVYVVAKLGPTGSGKIGNRFTVWGSNSSYKYSHWIYIGDAVVTLSYAAYVWAGFADFTFAYISIGVLTGDDPAYQYNDVLADIVWSTSG